MKGIMYTYFIADDETKIRQGIRRLIDWETSNGEDALRFILDKNPDVTLLDIRMPRLSGLDVARLARADGYRGIIIILSGYSDFKYAQEAMRYDVKYYISKPVDEDELTDYLKKVTDELSVREKHTSAIEYFSEKARDGILSDVLTGSSRISDQDLKELGLLFVCADMDGDMMYRQNLTGPIGLVIGNEGSGVSRLVKEKCDYIASIPMKGDIDSLNASVAAGVLAYEIVRQRME